MPKTGIDVIGDAPWGTHFCQLYRNPEELIEILILYFKAGIENNESCVWITSPPLTPEMAVSALRKVVPRIDQSLKENRLEIVPHTEWYLSGGQWDPQSIISRWSERTEQAISQGFDGLRAAGDTAWLDKNKWDALASYEASVDDAIGRRRFLSLCTYPLEKCTLPEILEVVRNHQFAIIRNGKGWELIESAGQKQKRAERRLDLLAKTASQLLESSSPQTVVDSLCRKVLEFLDCQIYFNYLVDDTQRSLYLNAYEGISEAEARKIAQMDFGISPLDCAPRDAKSFVCEDIQHTNDPRASLVRAYGMQAYAYHPLVSRGRILGTLSFATCSRSRFANDELSLIKAMADQAAIAIERARTQKDLETANEVLEQRVAERTAELMTEASARHKSQEAVKEQARFLESFFRYSISPLAFLDEKFNFIRVNQAYAKVWQREPEELIGRNHFELYPMAENQAIFESVARGKMPYVATAKAFYFPDHPDWGETYWDWTLVPILDAEGSIDFFFFTLTDVTRAKWAEEELRSSYSYSRNLLEASLDPLLTINIDGKITDVNNATELVTGVERARLIGSNFSDYFTDPQKANDGYQRVFEEGLVRDYLLTIRHVSGAKTDVLYNATVYRDDAGQIQGVFAAARDITELKNAERRRDFTNALLKLFAQKTSLKDYLDSALLVIRDWAGCQALGIRVVDAEQKIPYGSFYGFTQEFLDLERNLSLASNNCLCIRAISRKFADQDRDLLTIGGSFRCDNGLAFVNRLSPEEQAVYRGHCIKFGFTSLTVIPITYRDQILGAIHMADSREAFFSPATVEFLESISPLIGEAIHRFNAEEELARYRGHLEELVKQRTAELEAANAQLQTEIAERKIADENLGHTAAELARSNRDLEQFAYVASHDLQEPLRAVSGYIQLLRQRYTGKLDEKAEQYISGAVDGAARMQRLITDLLAFSRVGTRERTIELTDLTTALASALENLKVSIQEANAKITVDPLPRLRVDPTQIAQLFQNLIGNAVKFRSKQTPEIHIGAQKRPGDWLFKVKDNGIGISPQYAERIFMIFQRLHTRRKYSGTGIGLAICKKIVEQHGGKIWVESPADRGSTFYFTIPNP
jgi:PAS domain S-box-containing protein